MTFLILDKVFWNPLSAAFGTVLAIALQFYLIDNPRGISLLIVFKKRLGKIALFFVINTLITFLLVQILFIYLPNQSPLREYKLLVIILFAAIPSFLTDVAIGMIVDKLLGLGVLSKVEKPLLKISSRISRSLQNAIVDEIRELAATTMASNKSIQNINILFADHAIAIAQTNQAPGIMKTRSLVMKMHYLHKHFRDKVFRGFIINNTIIEEHPAKNEKRSKSTQRMSQKTVSNDRRTLGTFGRRNYDKFCGPSEGQKVCENSAKDSISCACKKNIAQ